MISKKTSFLVFMLICIGIFCALGSWQIKRLHWKENLIAELEQAYVATPALPFVTSDRINSLQQNQFLRGMFKGHLDFPKAFQLQGQIDDGKQTSHTLVPYIISPDLTVLVDFGPDSTIRDKDNANTVLTGLLRNAPKPNSFTPENTPDQNIWYSINPAQLKIEKLKPLVLLPEHTPWKEYPATKPELRNNHLQYAIFWFTLTAVIAGLTGYYLSRRD